MRNYKIILTLLLSIIISSCSTPDYPSGPSSIQPEASQNRWWKWRSEKPVDSRPFAYKGIIFAYSEKGILYAMDGISGDELWSFDFERDIYCFDDPLFYEELVLIALSSGSCYALNIYNGSVVWKIEQKKTPVKDLLDQLKSEIEMGIKPKDLKEYTSLKMPAESIFMYSNIHDDILFFCFSTDIIEIDSSYRPFATTKDYIMAINPGNGSILWEFPLPERIYSGYPIEGFSCKYNTTNAYRKRLTYNKPDNTYQNILGIYGYIALFAFEPFLFALDKNTGELLWEANSYLIRMNPYTDDGKLYTLIHDNYHPLFRALAPENGDLIWEYKLKKLEDIEPLAGGCFMNGKYGHLDFLFSKSEDTVILECYDNIPDQHCKWPLYLIAIDTNNGQVLWKRIFKFRAKVLKISGNIIYCISDRNNLSRLNIKTGLTLNSLKLQNEDFFHDFLQLHGNILLISSSSGSSHISAIDINTGNVIWRIDNPLRNVIAANNMIYCSYLKRIYAIDRKIDDSSDEYK